MIKPNTLIKMAAFAGASALVAGSAVAGDDCKAVVCDKAPVVEKPWTICNLFDNSTLYENDSNPFLQELALIGRYQGQWYSSDSNHGSDTDWENRRWRAGIKAKFLHDFEFDGQFNLKTDFHSDDRFIEDVEEVSIKWEATKDFYVQVGKFKPKVTNEWSTSSRNILTFERSLLVEQVRPEKLGGVAVGGKVGDFSYDLGIFEGAIDDDWTLPDFNGGISVLAKVGYKVTESTKVGFDYFYADQDKESLASGGV
ncbi:MAG TPA: porin, partial [Verrucomicrobiales bacterium]|nr:porin [Verrucomicrobiales bacterium]